MKKIIMLILSLFIFSGCTATPDTNTPVAETTEITEESGVEDFAGEKESTENKKTEYLQYYSDTKNRTMLRSKLQNLLLFCVRKFFLIRLSVLLISENFKKFF